MEEFKEQLYTLLVKWWAYPIYIMLGLVGKFGHDLSKGVRMPWWKVFSSIFIAVFVGFLTSVWCENNYSHLAPILVPTATLLSDKIITAIMSIKTETIREFIFKNISKK